MGGMLGMASGIFIVPILTICIQRLFDDVKFLHADVLIALFMQQLTLFKCRLTNIRLAIVLETATTLGALTGVLLVGIVPVSYLYFLFAGILFLSAHQMLAKRREVIPLLDESRDAWIAALHLDSSYPDRASGREVAYCVDRLPLGFH